ncbi:MAG: hypothetical protein WC809_20900 [Sinimarinibacterium sp.]
MKRILYLLLAAAVPGLATAADVGVSISIGEPGFYGQIDIGNFPRPVVLYPEPMVIEVIPVGVVRQPMYLRVPPGHAKKWGSYCGQYNACGHPVYFVQDGWYNDVYAPQYRAKHGGGSGQRHDNPGKGGNGNGGHGKSDNKHGKGDKGDKGGKGGKGPK